jgi:hypothetical protein
MWHFIRFIALLSFVTPLVAGCCPLLELEAQALERRYARCTSDDQCVRYRYDGTGYAGDDLEGLDGSCLGSFQCFSALNIDADLAAFTAQAQAISALHRVTCPVCSQGMCSPPGSPVCDTSVGRCEFDRNSSNTNADTGIETTPDHLDFGVLQPDMSLAMDVTITGIGVDTLYIEDLWIEDQSPFDAAPFDLHDGRIERILAPGQSTSVRVECTPNEEGDHTGLLVVLSNAGSGAFTQIPLTCSSW